MLRTEAEYRDALRRFQEEALAIGTFETKLRGIGFKATEIERALRTRIEDHRKLGKQIQTFERLRDGDVEALPTPSAAPSAQGIGKSLIAMRIALGMSPKDLANVLGVSEAKVVSDERTSYRGMSVQSAGRLLSAMRMLYDRTVSLTTLDVLGQADFGLARRRICLR